MMAVLVSAQNIDGLDFKTGIPHHLLVPVKHPRGS
jgi:hypothetical protein